MGIELGAAGIISLIGAGATVVSALAQQKGANAPAMQAPPAPPAPSQTPVVSAKRDANAAANAGPSTTDLTNGLLTPDSLKLGKGTLLGS